MNLLFLVNVGRRERPPEQAMLDQFDQILKQQVPNYLLAPCDCKETAEKHIAEGLKRGIDTIWIGGGDGTLNHVLNRTYGLGLTYGVVPMGTINALARALHIPEDPIEAVRYLLDSIPVPMDVGEVSGHRFLCFSSVGIHALILHQVSTEFKKRWGKLAFWESALRTIWHKSQLPKFTVEYQPYQVQDHIGSTSLETRRETGYSFVISNVSNFAGFNIILNQKAHGSGYLELHNFRQKRFRTFARWFARLKLWRHNGKSPGGETTLRRLSRAIVTANSPLSVQVDGEPVETPNPRRLVYICHPGAVRILLRRPEAQGLLSPDPNLEN